MCDFYSVRSVQPFLWGTATEKSIKSSIEKERREIIFSIFHWKINDLKKREREGGKKLLGNRLIWWYKRERRAARHNSVDQYYRKKRLLLSLQKKKDIATAAHKFRWMKIKWEFCGVWKEYEREIKWKNDIIHMKKRCRISIFMHKRNSKPNIQYL